MIGMVSCDNDTRVQNGFHDQQINHDPDMISTIELKVEIVFAVFFPENRAPQIEWMIIIFALQTASFGIPNVNKPKLSIILLRQ